MDRDAKLNELIRLKQTPSAPIERWQMMPTRTKAAVTSNRSIVADSPLRVCPTNISLSSKTPESNRLVIKYKRTPKLKGRSTPTKTPKHGAQQHKTPGHSTRKRTPPKSNKKKTPGRTGHTPSGCRFIPNRNTTDMEYSSFLVRQKDISHSTTDDGEGDSPSTVEYKQTLMNVISKGRGMNRQRGVLSFRPTSCTPSARGSFLNYTNTMSASHNGNSLRSSHRKSLKKTSHRIPRTADKILDAPNLVQDYYLNTLDWGKNNHVAIGLGPAVFLWNANDGSVQQLMEMGSEDEYISSLSWAGNGKYLAIGSSSAAIQLWDVEKEKKVRTMSGHSDRVGVLTWNKHMLTSGARNGFIYHHDVRKAEHIIAHSQHHTMEVCGLQWSPDGSKLASGANDNMVCIWNANNPSEPAKILRGHQAAVKAVAWCPWQPNVLVTGGGTNDKTIKFWNTHTGQCTDSVDTKSQVSAVAWNKDHRQLISSHGNPKNQMVIWQYPSMTKVGELGGHQDRVLHMCLSPRRSTVASAGADETLRIWQGFERLKHDISCRSYSEDSITALLHSVN